MRDFKAEVQTIKQNVESKKVAVRANKDFTAQAKQSQIKQILSQANAELQQVKKEYYSSRDQRMSELRNELWVIGHKSNSTESDKQARQQSYRDAIARSEKVAGSSTNPKAVKAALEKELEKARQIGDPLQAKAIGFVAKQLGINSVAKASLGEELHQSYDELINLENPSANVKLYEDMFFSPVSEN